ncbi:MAG: SIMPL domain-containing protein [Clostridium sp.]|nr:SIMPL domain-containing protein [Clostridium sp.]
MYKLNAKVIAVGMIMALFLVYGFMNTNAENAVAAEENAKRSLSVTGHGKTVVKADIAYVNVGVTTEAKSAKDAQANNSRQMTKVFSALKSAGIGENDIRTIHFDLSPKYNHIETRGTHKQVLVGYVVTNQIQVTVRNVDNVGNILDVATNAGANLSGGVIFSLSDAKMESAYAEALNNALKNGSAKADTLAKGLGVSLGKPKEVVEGGALFPQPLSNMRDAMRLAEVSTPIAAGPLEISATVSLKYEY